MSRKKIKVLQIIKSLDIGGAERFGIELALALNKSNFETKICVFFKQENSIEKYWTNYLNTAGIQTFILTEWRGNNNFNSYIRGIVKLTQLFQKDSIDICQSHFQLGTLAALFLRYKGITKAVIRTAHNHSRREWNSGLYGWIKETIIGSWIYPLLLNSEIGVSQAVVDDLFRHPGVKFSKNKPMLIYNGLSANFLAEVKKYRSFKSINKTDNYIVGCIGRLSQQKGHIYLLKAIPIVLKTLKETKFIIIGEGELQQYLENVSLQLGINNQLHFIGKRTDVISLLQQMDLFILPSLWEGLPTVILESMACEVPVIASDIPGICEIIDNNINGWLIPPADPSLLADKIIYTLTNPEVRKEITQKALLKLKKFQMKFIAHEYSILYQKLLE